MFRYIREGNQENLPKPDREQKATILSGLAEKIPELDLMQWLPLLSYFWGGVFLANAIPHFVSGMMGRPFQSPFAKPPGQGLSSSTVNGFRWPSSWIS
jgi:hypothetical protein